MTDSESLSNLRKAIDDSSGASFINRVHMRSFSLNIFLLNSQELIEITQQIKDPDEGLRLMSEGNQEEGTQVHREISRRIHNFVAAAQTLVEHSRNFMREHYEGTDVFARYEARIKADFVSDPLSQFVKDLRNFMVHRGLPSSEMYLNITSGGAKPGVSDTIDTGARLRSAELLDWDRWSAPGRAFIVESGDHVDVLTVAQGYSEKATAFNEWLHQELVQHHAADIAHARALEIRFWQQMSSRSQSGSPPPNADVAAEVPGVVTDEAIPSPGSEAKVDKLASSIKARIRKIEFPARPERQFTTERPVHSELTEKDIIGPILFWGPDIDGRQIFAFIHKGDEVFGLDAGDYALGDKIADLILTEQWAASTLSRTYIKESLVDWLRENFEKQLPSSYSTYLRSAAFKEVGPLTLWCPISHLELEAPLILGPVTFEPISKVFFDEFEEKLTKDSPERVEDAKMLVDKLRNGWQGFAAVVVTMTAEPERLREEGETLARAAIGLLRFMAPAAANYPLICPAAMLGSEIVPSTNSLIRGETTFAVRQSGDRRAIPSWQIPQAVYSQLQEFGLDELGSLVLPQGLSPFAFAVRSSILMHSTGETKIDPIERISYSFFAVEKLLLRHTAEAVEFNVARRISVLGATDPAKRLEINRMVREAYRIRSRRALTALEPHEEETIRLFIQHAYLALFKALKAVREVLTVAQFVGAIDSYEKRGAAPGDAER